MYIPEVLPFSQLSTSNCCKIYISNIRTSIDLICSSAVQRTSQTFMDLDSSLNLEELYYQEGFTEGSRVGETQGLIEGRIYGSEISYERYLSLGLLYGKMSYWKAKHRGNSRMTIQLAKLAELLDSVPRNNDEAKEGQDYETTMRSALRKMKVISSLCGESSLVKQGIELDSNTAKISGDLEDGAEIAVKLRGGKSTGCGTG